jgi:hypothetical protein
LRPIDPRHVNPTLSVEFIDVMADMMAKDPRERIPSAAEVVARLAPWVGPTTPIPETTYPSDGLVQDDSDADTEDSVGNIEGDITKPKRVTMQPSSAPASLSDEDDTFDDFRIEVDQPRRSASPSVFGMLLLFVLLSLAAASAAWLFGLLAR